jgi:hypothetical protein
LNLIGGLSLDDAEIHLFEESTMSQTVFGGQKGHSKARAKAPGTDVATPLEADLTEMKKAELIDLAGSLGVAVAPKATKAQIVAAILG